MSLLSPTLEAFWAVVRKGTVQDASKILGLTQTGVTQRIRLLEKQLQTTVFLRSRKGMKLTAEGEALLQYVKSSLDIEGMALSKIQRAANDSIIEIGITGPSSILRSRVIPDLTSLFSEYSKLKFRIDLSNSSDGIDKLKSGLFDLSLVESHQVARELDSKKLEPETYGLYGPAKWKKRTLEDILKKETFIEFDTNNHTSFLLLEKYKLKSKIRPERHFANTTEAISAMTAAGFGYSIISRRIAEPFIKKNQLVQLASHYFYDQKISLVWHPRHEMASYFKAIIQAIN